MKTILITGVAGLLGSHFSRYLLNKGYKVIGIDDLSGGYKDFLPNHPNFVFYQQNLESSDLDFIFLKYKPSCAFHFAAYAAEGLSPFIRKFNYVNNVLASMTVVNACIKHDCKLVFTSSMAVYGKQFPPFVETLRPNPIDPYGIAKYSVEQDIQQAHQQFGLKYTIIRPHNVLGIYQNIWDKYRNVIGIFIRRTLCNEPILIYGDGKQTRAFSDIKYYMEPFEKTIDSCDNEIVNIGADKFWESREVAEIVADIATEQGITRPQIEYKQPRHEVKHAFCDHTKAKEILSFKDETVLPDLISDMFVWAKEQPQREVKKIKYEVEKNIYDYWK